MEKQQVMAVVLLDLSAAFDTVDHQILLDILSNNFGISGNALKWYQSYLSDKSFTVVINGKSSEKKNLTFSVPQGSTSGANLFSIYCYTLGLVVNKDIAIQGFADDHSFRTQFNPNSRQDKGRAIALLEQTFAATKIWMDNMRLKLNPDKTEFILLGNHVQLAKCSTKAFNAPDQQIECSDGV